MITDINLTSTSSPLDVPLSAGGSIPGRTWGNATDCKAIVLLVHGLGAHSGWFEAFARQLKVKGLFVVSFDLCGFGTRHSDKFAGFTQWIDDVVRMYDYLKETNPGKPLFVAGNSMGALLSLVAVAHMQPDGLIVMSPGFDGYPQTFTWQYRLVTIIRALLWPEREVGLPYDESVVTRDEAARRFIANDKEGRFRVPGRYLLELLKLSNAVKDRGHSVDAPVLMLTAGQDRIVNNVVNGVFFDKLTAPSKRHKHFNDAWHDLMFDPLVDEVAGEVSSWVSEVCAQKLESSK